VPVQCHVQLKEHFNGSAFFVLKSEVIGFINPMLMVSPSDRVAVSVGGEEDRTDSVYDEFGGGADGGGESVPLMSMSYGSLEVSLCPICLEELSTAIDDGESQSSRCGHRFHSACLKEYSLTQARGSLRGGPPNVPCPICRSPLPFMEGAGPQDVTPVLTPRSAELDGVRQHLLMIRPDGNFNEADFEDEWERYTRRIRRRRVTRRNRRWRTEALIILYIIII